MPCDTGGAGAAALQSQVPSPAWGCTDQSAEPLERGSQESLAPHPPLMIPPLPRGWHVLVLTSLNT